MIFSTSSGKLTTTALVMSRPGALLGVDVTPPTSGSAILTIYDSDDSNVANRIILSEVHVDAGLTGVNHEYILPVQVNRGIYCTFSGTGSAFYIRYMAG